MLCTMLKKKAYKNGEKGAVRKRGGKGQGELQDEELHPNKAFHSPDIDIQKYKTRQIMNVYNYRKPCTVVSMCKQCQCSGHQGAESIVSLTAKNKNQWQLTRWRREKHKASKHVH